MIPSINAYLNGNYNASPSYSSMDVLSWRNFSGRMICLCRDTRNFGLYDGYSERLLLRSISAYTMVV